MTDVFFLSGKTYSKNGILFSKAFYFCAGERSGIQKSWSENGVDDSIFMHMENAENPYKQRGNRTLRYGVYLFLYIQSVFHSILCRNENVYEKS